MPQHYFDKRKRKNERIAEMLPNRRLMKKHGVARSGAPEDEGIIMSLPSDNPDRPISRIDTVTGLPTKQQVPAPLPPESEATKEDALRSITEFVPGRNPESQGGVRWETPGGQVGYSMNQQDADTRRKMFGDVERDSEIAFGDGTAAQEEAEIESEVNERMSKTNEQQNRRLDQWQRDQGIHPEQDEATPFMDAAEDPSTTESAKRWGGRDVRGEMEAAERAKGLPWDRVTTQEQPGGIVPQERIQAADEMIRQRKAQREEEFSGAQQGGFLGSQREFRREQVSRAEWESAINRGKTSEDFESWKETRAEQFQEKMADVEAKRDEERQAKEGIARGRRESRQTSRDEAAQSRRDMRQMRSEAAIAGFKEGTPEFTEYMNREMGGRQHELDLLEKEFVAPEEAKGEAAVEEQTVKTGGEVEIAGVVTEGQITIGKDANEAQRYISDATNAASKFVAGLEAGTQMKIAEMQNALAGRQLDESIIQNQVNNLVSISQGNAANLTQMAVAAAQMMDPQIMESFLVALQLASPNLKDYADFQSHLRNVGTAGGSTTPGTTGTPPAPGTTGTPPAPGSSFVPFSQPSAQGATAVLSGTNIPGTPEQQKTWDKLSTKMVSWKSDMGDVPFRTFGMNSSEIKKYAGHMHKMDDMLKFIRSLPDEEARDLADQMSQDVDIAKYANVEMGGYPWAFGSTLENAQKGFLNTCHYYKDQCKQPTRIG